MTQLRYVFSLVAGVLSLAGAGAVSARDHKFILPEAARTVDGGRDVQVLIAQDEIKSTIVASSVSAVTGGGLLAALIDAKVNNDRARKAEATIQPLRQALIGFDADTLALDGAKSAMTKLPWFQSNASLKDLCQVSESTERRSCH